jgi:Golgi phosphoprotein 3 (GPP34)
VTLALDILLLNIDPNLQRVREREYAGYAMRAADLIELTVAGRLTLEGRWVTFIRVIDTQPTGEPLLDAALENAGHLRQAARADRLDGQASGQPGRGRLPVLAAQGAVRLYSRQVTRRLTLTEPTLLDLDRQAQVRARLDRYIAAGSAADVLDWALAGLEPGRAWQTPAADYAAAC